MGQAGRGEVGTRGGDMAHAEWRRAALVAEVARAGWWGASGQLRLVRWTAPSGEMGAVRHGI